MTDYKQLAPLSDFAPVNPGLKSANETAMIRLLGQPKVPLTVHDQPSHASDLVKAHLVTANVGPFKCTGFDHAVQSLAGVMASVRALHPDLYDVLGYGGMIAVRLRKPAHGAESTQISNHAWGTAVDIKIGGVLFKETGDKVPLGIGLLIAPFNRAGWYAGCAFQDDMHFEVTEQTIKTWQSGGHLSTARGLFPTQLPDDWVRVVDGDEIIHVGADDCTH